MTTTSEIVDEPLHRERPDTRHLYGHLISLADFRQAFRAGDGFCRGCSGLQSGIPPKGRGITCPDCGARRVFSALEFAKNGWIAELRPGRRSDQSIERLLATGEEVGGSDALGRRPAAICEDRSRQ